MADCLSQRKTKTLKISTHQEVKVLLLKNWIDDLKKKYLVFDCEQFSCYPTENTWHQDSTVGRILTGINVHNQN